MRRCKAKTQSGARCKNKAGSDGYCHIVSHCDGEPPDVPEGLNVKQARFSQEYVIDLNATQAAIRAGYSKKTAGQIGHELLKKPEIADAIAAAMNDRAARTNVTADRVLYELARIAFANMAEYVTIQDDGSAIVDLSQLTPDRAAAIQEVITETYIEGRGEAAVPVKKMRLKLHARSRALELLGKHTGLFAERLEHTGRDGAPIATTAIPWEQLSLATRKKVMAELEGALAHG